MNLIVGKSETLSASRFRKIGSYRQKVFVEQLGWDLQVVNGAEIDQFDHPDTVYVVAEDELGEVTGCARLLPTNRPYLLGDVFPQLMNGQPVPCSPDVWELSRFAAADVSGQRSPALSQFSSAVTVELLRFSIAYAASQGAKRLITVSPLGVERLLRRYGFHCHRAGPPMIVNGHPIFACWIEIE